MAGTRRKTASAIKTNNNSANKRAKTVLDLGWKAPGDDDDEIDSDDDLHDNRDQQSDDDEEEEEETLEAKKVRLARDYLTRIEKGASSSSEDDDDDDDEEEEQVDRVGLKLQKQRLLREGAYERAMADKLGKRLEAIHLDIEKKRRKEELNTQEQAQEWIDNQHVTLLKGHDLTTTCIGLLQADGSRAVSGSKDHSVILWDVEHAKRIVNIWDHWRKYENVDRTKGQVLSVACSDDGRYVAVGRKDATVSIFDIRQQTAAANSSNPVKVFTGHKSGVTCLTFQTQSLQLFSGSEDRCIRHYNVEEMMYLETLYGHQFGVTGLDCHLKERPISVGRDRTARAWRPQESNHLIYRGGAKMVPAECVSLLKDDWFLTGHENGQLCLWMTEKKKTMAAIDFAHGCNGQQLKGDDSSSAVVGIGNSIASIAALKGSDVACTGSNDGFLRFWKARTGRAMAERGLDVLGKVPIHGYINGVCIGPKAKFCVVAVGQEPRLGRWNRVAKAKNRVGIVKLDFEVNGGDEEDEGDDNDSAGDDDE